MTQDKKHRLSIPEEYKTTLPFIWWALLHLRAKKTNQINWVSLPPRLSEGMAQPALSSFTEETQERINALSELHNKSRSCVVVTALETYKMGPSKPDKPKGLKANEGDK